MQKGKVKKMETLKELQDWYASHCDGEWEHHLGIRISTLDNPGWCVDINLAETELMGKSFEEHSYGVGESADSESDEWMTCEVKNDHFVGHGGPQKLEEMLQIFLRWAKT